MTVVKEEQNEKKSHHWHWYGRWNAQRIADRDMAGSHIRCVVAGTPMDHYRLVGREGFGGAGNVEWRDRQRTRYL